MSLVICACRNRKNVLCLLLVVILDIHFHLWIRCWLSCCRYRKSRFPSRPSQETEPLLPFDNASTSSAGIGQGVRFPCYLVTSYGSLQSALCRSVCRPFPLTADSTVYVSLDSFLSFLSRFMSCRLAAFRCCFCVRLPASMLVIVLFSPVFLPMVDTWLLFLYKFYSV